MRGTGPRFVKPKQQLGLLLPTLVTALLCVFFGYIMMEVCRYAAFVGLQKQGVEAETLAKFISITRLCLWVFWGGALLLLSLGGLWAWWVSCRIFGSVSRLERDLQSVLRGESKLLNLRVRKDDALHDLFHLFEQFLNRPRG